MSVPSPAAALSGGLSARQLQLLAGLAAQLADAPGLPTLVARLAQGLPWLVEFDQLALAMRGADGRTWALIRPRLAGAGEPGWIEFGDADSALERAMRTGGPAAVDRAGSQLHPPGLDASGAVADLSSFPSGVCVPLRGADGPLGALGVFSARGGVYRPGDQHVLELLARLVETAARKLVLMEEASRADAEVRRAARLGSELGALVAQELAAPLSSIESNLDFLQSALLPKEAPEARELVDDLRLTAAGLAESVANLVDVARLEDGGAAARRESVALEQWVRERAAGRAAAARAVEVRLVARCEPAGAVFSFDQALMARVVDNLLSNALRAAPKRGQVALVARVAGGTLNLAVGDTGPAVPEEQRERIFTKHGAVEGDAADPPVRGGRALSLYFCRLAVELHGGSIGVEQLPSGQTLFRIVLRG